MSLGRLPVTAQSANNSKDVDFALGYELTESLANGNKTAGTTNSGAAVHDDRSRDAFPFNKQTKFKERTSFPNVDSKYNLTRC